MTDKDLDTLARIREALGVGHVPMLTDLPKIIRKMKRNADRYAWLKTHNLNGVQLNHDDACLHICNRGDEILDTIDICNLDKTIDATIKRIGKRKNLDQTKTKMSASPR